MTGKGLAVELSVVVIPLIEDCCIGSGTSMGAVTARANAPSTSGELILPVPAAKAWVDMEYVPAGTGIFWKS